MIRESELCNFADDNTLYTIAKTLAEVVDILGLESLDIIRWFEINGLLTNPSNFQVMFLGNNINIPRFSLVNFP